MAIANYIREIGRGKEGARSLTREQSHDLFAQVLDGRVTDLEVGAFALAMRVKGESVEELIGFCDATLERTPTIACRRPTVVLPSYNGARKLPNLTALLALLLAQEGIDVLVHGPAQDPGRVTTADIFRDLGLPSARHADDVAHGWARREPVFMPIDALSPPLARLLDVRRVVGVRNSGHTVAKLLSPCAGAPVLRVANYTHPEYATLMTEFLAATQADALLMRGTEGEPVADPRRAPKLDVYVAGQLRVELSRPAQEGVLTELPLLPRNHDAATTALYILNVVSGEKPAPAPLMQQVECIVQALGVVAQREQRTA